MQLFIYSLQIGVAIWIFLLGVHYYPKKNKSIDTFIPLSWFFFTLLIALSVGLLSYTLLSIISNHSEFIIKLMGEGKDSSTIITVLLGFLGIVMTMITAGVYTISERAVERVKRAAAVMKQDAHEKLSDIQKIKEDMDSLVGDAGELKLIQQKILLRFQCEMEKNRFEEDIASFGHRFREPLYSIYASGSENDFVTFLEIYTTNELEILSPDEIIYLQLLKKHYEFSTIQTERELSGRIGSLLYKLKNKEKFNYLFSIDNSEVNI